jgi:hypothetical protein
MSEAQEEMGPALGASRGESLPASELADLAANVSGRPSPAVVWNNADAPPWRQRHSGCLLSVLAWLMIQKRWRP